MKMNCKENSIFTFFPETHTYCLDGKIIPSVSELTGIFSTINAQEDTDLELTIEAAAERGTVLHSYLEHRLSGEDREDFELPGAYQDYADSVDLFLMEHSIAPFLIEMPLWGEASCVRYAGTPDCVGIFDGLLSILDWKFVSQVQKTKVGAQLNAYMSLCEYNGIFPDQLYCVQFLKAGAYRLYSLELSNVFRLCLDVHKEKLKKHPRGRIV